MGKIQLKLVKKTDLISKVFFLVFKSEIELGYVPGQFFSLEIQPKVFRPYSVCYVGKTLNDFEVETGLESLTEGEYVCFMISTKPGGTASHFFEEVKEGHAVNAIGPAGSFKLKEKKAKNVFVSTGTGLAPFVPMINLILEESPNAEVNLFFGCWNLNDNFVLRFFPKFLDKSKYPNFKIYVVAEDLQNQPESDFLKEGRVTGVIPKVLNNLFEYNYYLCGHPAMVSAMEEVLLKQGVSQENLVLEKFGSGK